MHRLFLFSLLVIFILFSCKREEEVFDSGSEYYPIRSLGSYIIYDVHHIKYNASGRDTIKFQLMEMIGDTLSLNGRVYYKILRYRRTDDSESWPAQPDSVWKTYKIASEAIKTENNIDLIKMVFPVEEGKSWDANVLNTWGPQVFSMKKKGYPYAVNNHSFSNTLTVMERFDTTAINKNIIYEVYSKDLGLIHKSMTNLELCQTGTCIMNHYIGKDSIVSGEKYEQRFNSYQ
jgi:hypothetical protein